MEPEFEDNNPPRFKKLRGMWSIEMQEDLKSYFGSAFSPFDERLRTLKKAGLKLR
jgi:hypothetical protein